MVKTLSIAFLLGAAFLLVAAEDARCEAPTLLSWLQAAPAQWGPSGDFEGEKEGEGESSGGKKGALTLSGGLRVTMAGRHLHLTHLSQRPRSGGPFHHTHLDEDSDWYVTTQIGALRVEGTYPVMDKLTVRGTVLLGANGFSFEYRQGTGNTTYNPPWERSYGFDTLVGWYPLDMFYGLEVGATYELMENLSAGGRWSMHIGSAPSEEWSFMGPVEKGWYTFFGNDFDFFAEYTTEYGTPWAGLGISLYEAWIHTEDQDGSFSDYKLHLRETQWFQIVMGYKVELKSGHFIGVRMALVSQWSFSMEAGYKFM
ncbi:MAG: hypothetical protein ACYS47_12975 [Planctomycetota bacterium]|jgi:hypothetical protein